MIDEGYAATQILSQVHDVVIEEKLGDKQKSVIAEKMAVSGNISAYILINLPNSASFFFFFFRLHSILYQHSDFRASVSVLGTYRA